MATALALLSAGPASAAAPTVTLTATGTPGSAAVSFTATVSGSATGDTGYLCFGDEAPTPCDGSHPGTAVDMAAATGPAGATVNHSYAAEGSYQAVLYEVQPGTPDTVTASAPASVTVTIDGTARLTSTVSGLSATFDGSTSTAAVGDTWWACFGDNLACNASAPDKSGTVAAGAAPLQAVTHSYAAPGSYPASLTVVGTATTSTAAAQVSVNYPHPTAVLSADSTSGSGSLPVTFDGSKSVVAAGDTWQFCYGDVATCSQSTPD
ncbi:MAG: hypothetical protein ABI140_10015, partial [Jatrophihabitantaceae bacterium]